MMLQTSKPVPISVLLPTRNESRNLPRCLDAIKDWADEIVIVDSHSSDSTVEIAQSYGAQVLQFDYQGGWPKKRQWALDTFPFRNQWILVLDADEILLEPVKQEIGEAVRQSPFDGYWVRFEIVFLGRQLRHGNGALWKLSLFRRGKGRYEEQLKSQDASMGDMEVHEHVVVDGCVARLKHPVRHENINALDRFIQKHNEYSNWSAKSYLFGGSSGITPRFWGNQAERRRWLRRRVIRFPCLPFLYFLLVYVLKCGFLDGIAGYTYAAFHAIQIFHTKAKIYELKKGLTAPDALTPSDRRAEDKSGIGTT
jgi:glycosyltransferase involved in cell wall biosynthesis